MSFFRLLLNHFSQGKEISLGGEVVHVRAAFIIKGLRLLEMKKSKMSLDKA